MDDSTLSKVIDVLSDLGAFSTFVARQPPPDPCIAIRGDLDLPTATRQHQQHDRVAAHIRLGGMMWLVSHAPVGR